MANKSKAVAIKIEEYLVKALGVAVEKLPRGMNVKAGEGVRFKGVLGMAVEAVFVHILINKGHELALVENKECSEERPCMGCRKDVFRAHVKAACDAGLVVMVKGVKWDTFYAQSEVGEKHYQVNKDVAEEVLAQL